MEATDPDTAQLWASNIEAFYCRTSATDYDSVVQLFEGVALRVVSKAEHRPKRAFTLTEPETRSKRAKRKRCC